MHNSELLILFGYPGAGKSFIGELMAREYGYYFVEGDGFLTPVMIELLAQHKMVDDETFAQSNILMAQTVLELSKDHSRVVLAHAMNREITRQVVREYLPHAVLCWIETEEQLHRQRLEGRKNHVLSTEMALKIKEKFAPLPVVDHVIHNNGDENNIRRQLDRILLAHRAA